MQKENNWYAEDSCKQFRRWSEEAICQKLGIKSTQILFKIPRDRIYETDGGAPDCGIQRFESNQLPEYVQGKIESIMRVSGKNKIVISLQPLEFKDEAKLMLSGAYGWKTGVRTLNEFCRCMCAQKGVVSARSMMLSDLIGLDWRGDVKYEFKEKQFSVESFLEGQQEKTGKVRKYPTWKATQSGDFGILDECLDEEMSLECSSFWLATRVAIPVKKFQGNHDGLLYSIAYYENGHICMDSGLFGTNGRELGFENGLEWKFSNQVRPVVLLKQQDLESKAGPVICNQ